MTSRLVDEIAAEVAELVGDLEGKLDAELEHHLARIGRLVEIARLADAPPIAADNANPTWAEIFRGLPPMMRRALLRRIVTMADRPPPSPAKPAWREREARLEERDDLVCFFREWVAREKSDRAAALDLVRVLRLAIVHPERRGYAARINQLSEEAAARKFRRRRSGTARIALSSPVLSDETIRAIWRKRGVGRKIPARVSFDNPPEDDK